MRAEPARATRRLSLESSAFRPEAVSCRPCRSTFARALPRSRCSRSSWRSSRLRRTPACRSEVRGVGEDIRANVLAYLSFERYKNSDDLSPEFVERLQERSEREVRRRMRPFGFYEPDGHLGGASAKAAAASRTTASSSTSRPASRWSVDKVDVKVTGPGATTKVFTRHHRRPAHPDAATRLNHSNYEALKGGAAARRGHLRLSRRAHAAQRDARRSAGLHRADRHRIRNRRALPLRRDHHQAGHASTMRWCAASCATTRTIRSTPRELLRTQFALDDSQYFSTVEVLPEERDREQPHRADQHHRRTEPPPPLLVRRGLRHRHAGARHGRLGRPARQLRAVTASARKSRPPRLAQSLDARYIVPIGDPATEKFTLQLTGEHERRADVDDRTVDFMPSFTHVRGSWFGEHYWQRVTYVELLRHANPSSSRRAATTRRPLLIPGISFALVPQQLSRRGAVQPHAVRGAARLAQRARLGFGLPAGARAGRARVRLRAEVARAAARRHRRHRGVQHQRPRALAALLRRRRSQRARLRRQRSVAGGAGHRRERQSVFNDDGSPKLEKVGGKHLFAGSVELIRDLPKNFAVAVFADAGQRVRQLRRSARCIRWASACASACRWCRWASTSRRR